MRIRYDVPAALLCAMCALPQTPARQVPAGEKLSYTAEWRLIHAGNARLVWGPGKSPSDGGGWEANLSLESVGLVSRLYKVNNQYFSRLSSKLCVESSLLKTNEGNKKREATVTYDAVSRKARYLERDLSKNTIVDSHDLEIRPCEYDVVAALYHLRTLDLAPGQSAQIPMSDGKQAVLARVEAQERETIHVDGVTYKTLRYEAYLFNGVLYRRRGRLFVWLTDDDRRVPVRIRVRLPFYIGTVTLDLQKEGKG